MEIYDENRISAENAGVHGDNRSTDPDQILFSDPFKLVFVAGRRAELEKLGAVNNRRALKDIKNFVGGPTFSRAITKRGLQEYFNQNLFPTFDFLSPIWPLTSYSYLISSENANVSRRPITR